MSDDNIDAGASTRTSDLRIAIVGAGMGGLAASAALRRLGADPVIYEQAGEFSRIGAGIHVAANAMKVLMGLGLPDEVVREKAFINGKTSHREYDTGELTGELDHGPESTARFGAPYTTWHRGDLHKALTDLVPDGRIVRGKQVVGLEGDVSAPVLRFADGTSADADIVIAADGVRSPLRTAILGERPPRFTNRIAYRAVVSRERVGEPELDDSCKWWGPDRHIVHYYVSGGREIAFTTSVPDADWNVESWSAEGDVATFQEAFADFHPRVQKITHAVDTVHRWGINTHDPLPTWHAGNVVLIGDAAHPVTPYMGQGAALAMEDAVVLSRSLLDGSDDVTRAIERFESARIERTSTVQRISEANTWGRRGEDTSWLYGYDAWSTPIA